MCKAPGRSNAIKEQIFIFELSVTVVVTDPSALVVTVVVSEEEDEDPPPDAAPVPDALLEPDVGLLGSSAEASDVPEAPMVKLMGRWSWSGGVHHGPPCVAER